MKYLLSILIALLPLTIFAQLTVPRPSPLGSVSQKVGLNDVAIDYSRPGVKGRVIFGELVPFDALWRTGANAATKLTLSGDATIGGQEVPAGEYSILTIPGQLEWTVIINKDAGTSVTKYSEEKDQVRFTVKSEPNPEPVETFTISITDVKTESAMIQLSWESTRIRFLLETEVDEVVMEQIEKAMKGIDAMTYYRSAMYYYDTERDLDKALEWIDLALQQRETFWMVHSKAKVQAKKGDYKAAIESAKRSRELAVENENDSYVRLNDKAIANWSKGKK